MAERTAAKVTNAWVKAHLAQGFPGVRFVVNGRSWRTPTVRWVDGPTDRQVYEFLRDVPEMTEWPWAGGQANLSRTHSPELIGVSMLRERRSGDRGYYYERDHKRVLIEPGDVRDERDLLSSWNTEHYTLDGRTVTDEERQLMRFVLEMTGGIPERGCSGQDEQAIARAIGRTLFHYGDALEAALADCR